MKLMLLAMRLKRDWAKSLENVSSKYIAICSVVLFLMAILFFKIKQGTMSTPIIIQQTQSIVENQEIDLMGGNWNYLSTVTRVENGFEISPINFEIVNQNSSLSQLNPGVNLAGTYVAAINGDFELNATLDQLEGKEATLDLYGQVPIIADEFRVDKERARFVFTSNSVKVELWNQSSSTPVISRAYYFDLTTVVNFKLIREGEDLFFYANNTKLGSVNESGVFQKGQIWFGLESSGGKWLLTNFVIKPFNPQSSLEISDAATTIVENSNEGLQSQALKKRPDFLVGSAVALGPLVSDPDYSKIALDKNIFGILTAENDMKMINLQPQRGVYTFQKADAIVSLARQNGQKVHGHTLVFGEANPTWFSSLPVQTAEDKQAIKGIMLDHISTVISHFKDDIISWDVVNEPLADYDEMENGATLRNHKWYQAMGEDYIVAALEAAYNANPNAMLFINEYGLEADGDRWNTFLSLMKRVKERLEEKNIPVDRVGVGFQAHVYDRDDRIDVATLTRHIKALEALDFKTQISEMDVYSDDGDSIQAGQYTDIFNTCLSQKNCVAWKVWILSDRYDIWRDEEGQVRYGIDGLFDKDINPRPAYLRLQELVK